VLERTLTNDHADQPAVARRRELLRQTPRPEPLDPKEALARAKRRLREVERRGEPYLRPLHAAEADLTAAKHQRWVAERARATAPRWRRPLLAHQVAEASASVDAAQDHYDTARADAPPALSDIEEAQVEVARAQVAVDVARTRERLDRFVAEVPSARPRPRRGDRRLRAVRCLEPVSRRAADGIGAGMTGRADPISFVGSDRPGTRRPSSASSATRHPGPEPPAGDLVPPQCEGQGR